VYAHVLRAVAHEVGTQPGARFLVAAEVRRIRHTRIVGEDARDAVDHAVSHELLRQHRAVRAAAVRVLPHVDQRLRHVVAELWLFLRDQPDTGFHGPLECVEQSHEPRAILERVVRLVGELHEVALGVGTNGLGTGHQCAALLPPAFHAIVRRRRNIGTIVLAQRCVVARRGLVRAIREAARLRGGAGEFVGNSYG
jgi:hypothetical protein